MKILEILNSLKPGDIIPKRVLYILQRKGLIYGYSPFGYLESQHVYYKINDDVFDIYTASGKKINLSEPGSISNPFESYYEMVKNGYLNFFECTYMGFTFENRYISGCFNDYLVLKEKK